MNSRLSPASRLAFLLIGLTLAVCLLAARSEKPAPATNSAAISKPELADAAASAGDYALPKPPAPVDDIPEMAMSLMEDNAPREPGEETPVLEGSWAKELRELLELAGQDPPAALEQVARMSDKEERQTALKEVCLQLSRQNPAQAMNAAWRLELGKDGGLAGQAALEKMAAQWAAADLPAALAWASEQPEDADGCRDRIMKGIASIWSQTTPADAARLVAEQMSPNHAQFDAAMIVLGEWAATDFSGAAAWVDLFPEGPIQDRGREELSKTLSRQQSAKGSN